MKRLLAITSAVLLAGVSLAFAQQVTTPQTKPLAEVAKQEEERRKSVRKPAKVYTNGSLKPDISAGVPPPPSVASSTTSGNASAANATPATPAAGGAPAGAGQGQEYWSGRMKAARDAQSRLQLFADSLQTRINSLQTDFVNRDDPAQKAKIKSDLDTALAELERVKKDLEDSVKAIAAIEDEARRAGVPVGWLRPGA